MIFLNPYTEMFGAAYDPYTEGSAGILDGDNMLMNKLNAPVYAGFDVGHLALIAGGLLLFMKLRK